MSARPIIGRVWWMPKERHCCRSRSPTTRLRSMALLAKHGVTGGAIDLGRRHHWCAVGVAAGLAGPGRPVGALRVGAGRGGDERCLCRGRQDRRQGRLRHCRDRSPAPGPVGHRHRYRPRPQPRGADRASSGSDRRPGAHDQPAARPDDQCISQSGAGLRLLLAQGSVGTAHRLRHPRSDPPHRTDPPDWLVAQPQRARLGRRGRPRHRRSQGTNGRAARTRPDRRHHHRAGHRHPCPRRPTQSPRCPDRR